MAINYVPKYCNFSGVLVLASLSENHLKLGVWRRGHEEPEGNPLDPDILIRRTPRYLVLWYHWRLTPLECLMRWVTPQWLYAQHFKIGVARPHPTRRTSVFRVWGFPWYYPYHRRQHGNPNVQSQVTAYISDIISGVQERLGLNWSQEARRTRSNLSSLIYETTTVCWLLFCGSWRWNTLLARENCGSGASIFLRRTPSSRVIAN